MIYRLKGHISLATARKKGEYLQVCMMTIRVMS